jgi:RHH-type transcriptional regulator, proline utilization regulon repressor / proline dehydrogenase / delta 1-pyrroline-5-carboxylate dehydrogenase
MGTSTGSLFRLDVQRMFGWFPPETPLGESLFRLAEALERTPDRPSRAALLAERLPALRWPALARIALPFASLAMGAVARQFVYAEQIGKAIPRAARAIAGQTRTRFSFDMLGEGARTSRDAERNFARYLEAIKAVAKTQQPSEALGVSVKLSSIHPRHDGASHALVRGELLLRLKTLCRAAAGAGIALTVDAEESERTRLQLDLFGELALDRELLAWRGFGLAVQAYRTDVLQTLEDVIAIANARKSAGGKRICVRLVKGAYWDAEIKRAQELGLDDYPVFTDKVATDLAYVACAKRLLGNARLVHAQFATHNPVTLGSVLALAGIDARSPKPPFECQRLHGMGQGLDAALARLFPQVPMRIYAPVGERSELLAYLVRRLLENSASTSYVRQASLARDRNALLEAGFAYLSPRPAAKPLAPPTAWLLPERRLARGRDLADVSVLEATARAVDQCPRSWTAGPLIGGKPQGDAKGKRVVSPARPDVSLGEVVEGTAQTARMAVGLAFEARDRWASTDVEMRSRALMRLADLLEERTVELIALCVWEAGKTLPDALADVREAVDFCRYYAVQARQLFGPPMGLPGPVGETNVMSLHGRGVFACISPWNFPVAIFTGQVAAALAAGNAVVAKPAEQTPLTAYRVSQLILEAGIPKEVFHLVPGSGEEVGRAIVEDPRIAGVVFTGSNATAASIQRALAAREGAIVPLIAETGGMNAMIVDSTALPEQVVDAVVASAFRSAGQRCSSLRVLYLQQEIGAPVLEMLRGAVAALRVGDPADPAIDIGPVIDEEARAALAAYIDGLRTRARLVAEATAPASSGTYVAPVVFEVGSMRDVPGERFGPILHVVRFSIGDLDRVIDEINATGFGLTLGVHTRLEGRAEHIRRRAKVGNLYVNRNMIGAVIGVQPFGGEGLSGTGPKAGGPHYLARFGTERVFTVNTAAAGGDLRLLTGGT